MRRRRALAEVIDGDEVRPGVGSRHGRRGGCVLHAPVGDDLRHGRERRDVNPDGRFAGGAPGVDLVREKRAVGEREAEILAVRPAVRRVEAILARGRKAHEDREVVERRGDAASSRRDRHRFLVVRRVDGRGRRGGRCTAIDNARRGAVGEGACARVREEEVADGVVDARLGAIPEAWDELAEERPARRNDCPAEELHLRLVPERGASCRIVVRREEVGGAVAGETGSPEVGVRRATAG